MLSRTEGIVLKNSPYAEADLFVTHLTSHMGLVRSIAKSPRKVKSRFGSSLEPLTYCHISYWGKEEASLPKLTQSDIIRPHQHLRDRIATFMKVSEIVELCLRFLPEREPNLDAFLLLRNTLSLLDSGMDTAIGVLSFKVKFLSITGHAPRLSSCTRCGNRVARNTSSSAGGKRASEAVTASCGQLPRFYVPHGGLLCLECARHGKGYVEISQGAVRLYESLSAWDIIKLPRLKAAPGLGAELNGLLDAHIEYTLAGPLKTRNFAYKEMAG